MDKLLNQHPPSNYSTYREFIRDLIQDGISNHGFTFDHIHYELYRLNGQIYEALTKEAFNCYRGRLPNRILTSHVHASG